MKERPILFTGPMVRAILEGRKSQTRRLLEHRVLGNVGDRLWVKENFWIDHYEFYPKGRLPKTKPPEVDHTNLIYAADGSCCEQLGECGCEGNGAILRPSIFMPRWASRITLVIDRVVTETLGALTEEQARAEGIREFTKDGDVKKYWACDPCDGELKCAWKDLPRTAVEAYRALWLHINGPRSWWHERLVRVYEFRDITEEAANTLSSGGGSVESNTCGDAGAIIPAAARLM